MEIKMEFNFYDLQQNCWSGALDTLETIYYHDMEDEFMDYMEQVFYDEIPTLTEVNDWLRFEADEIFNVLGIDECEDEE